MEAELIWSRLDWLITSLLSLSQSLGMEAETGELMHQQIALACTGDSDAFGDIVATYQSTIALQMRRFSRDPLVVEELVHDVFVEAYVSLGTYKERSPFLHWLRRIAVRVGYRYWRRNAKSQTVPLSNAGAAIEINSCLSVNHATAASEMLGDLLELLRPRDRLVLTMLYWDGCSIAEAADLVGWTEAMVKVQAHRARKRLGKLISDSEGDRQ